jgi:hypothetical protein
VLFQATLDRTGPPDSIPAILMRRLAVGASIPWQTYWVGAAEEWPALCQSQFRASRPKGGRPRAARNMGSCSFSEASIERVVAPVSSNRGSCACGLRRWVHRIIECHSELHCARNIANGIKCHAGPCNYDIAIIQNSSQQPLLNLNRLDFVKTNFD